MKYLFCLLLYLPVQLMAQDSSLSLATCQSWAREHYPMLSQKEVIAKVTALQLKNTKSNYLPQVDLNAQATYQSDVTQIPIKLPNFDIQAIPNDQYKATVDVKQLIYDGGTIRQQQELHRANEKVSRQQLEVELYQLRLQVAQVFFNAILHGAYIESAEQVIEDISQRIERLKVGVSNGAVLQSNVDLLEAERLKAEQQLFEARTGKETALELLSILTGKNIDGNTRLEMPPAVEQQDAPGIMRPELLLYSYQSDALNAQDKLVATKNIPKLSAFVQGGYGRPGLNMLENEFRFFYIAGIKLNWNIWNWKQQQNERKILQWQEQTFSQRSETFELNTRMQLLQQQAEMKKMRAAMDKDERIVDLRNKVKDVSATQLDNGAVTVHDYLADLYAASQSKIQYKTHAIQWLLANIQYQIIKGN